MFVGQDRETNQIVALKRINTEQEENGFPITAIREVKILKALRHENIVNLKEIVTSKGEWLSLVLPWQDLSFARHSFFPRDSVQFNLPKAPARLLSRNTALPVSALYKPMRHFLCFDLSSFSAIIVVPDI